MTPGERFSRWTPLWLTAVVVVLLDQVTKAWIEAHLAVHDSITLIDGFLRIVHVRNPGAAFSFLASAPAALREPFFIGVTAVAIVVVLVVAARLEPGERRLRWALGGVLGGAVGNLIDRLRVGEVVDFVDVHWGAWHWPAFNVADSSISVAVVVILFESFRRDRSQEA